MYGALYWTHLTCVVLSISGFLLRGTWMLMDSGILRRRAVRVLPHFIDTVLLLSALGLALTIQQYPLADGWLTAKVIALLAYIGFGVLALRGKTKGIRAGAFVIALATAFYIVMVALTKNAVPGI